MEKYAIGASAVVICIILVLWGSDIGRDVIVDNCDIYGKFKYKDVIYSCLIVEQSHKGE
jgi:hypothetical protein